MSEFFIHAPTGMARVGLDGRFELVNDALCRLLGRERDELIGLDASMLTHPDDRAASASRFAKAWETSGPGLHTDLEKRCLRKDGLILHARLDLIPLRDATGAPLYTLVQVHDIGEQWRQAQNEIAQKCVFEMLAKDAPLETLLAEVVERAERIEPEFRASILMLDPTGKFFDHSTSPTMPLAYTQALLGLEIREGFGSCGTAAARGERVVVNDIQTHPYWTDYLELAELADIKSCWSQPIFGTQGRTLGTFAMYGDEPAEPTARHLAFIESMATLVGVAVERRQTTEALRISQARFRTMVEHAPEAVLLFDYETRRLIEANRRVGDLFGLSPSEVLDTNLATLFPARQPDGRDSASAILEHLHEARKGGCPVFDWTFLDLAGQRLDCEVRLVRLPTATGTLIRGSLVDIGERLKSERALRASETSLRTTLDSLGEAVIATDSLGGITQFNPIAEQLTGYRLEDARGRPVGEVVVLVDPESRAPIEDVFRRGGREAPTLLLSRNGQEYFVNNHSAPILGPKGETAGLVIVLQDMTQQHAAQERDLQARKLAAIGQLAGGVAHDFNNLLTGILGNSEMLEAHADPSVQKPAAMIAIAARRAADLTGQLLRFSRKEPAVHCRLDLHFLLRETCQLLFHSLDKRIELRLELHSQQPNVLGNASQLQNAFLNLGLNARDALVGAGLITIRTRDVQVPEASIEVAFIDEGLGIEPHVQQHIFEPFFTTKGVGAGTGLGLAGAYGIVQSHGGRIEVFSEPGAGSSFVITLPQAHLDSAPVQVAQEATQLGAGRILVVDDEELVRGLLVEALERFGYEVVAVHDGVEAERVFAVGRFDLVILDLVMPKRSGYETFQALIAIDPAVRVLIATGFARDRSVEEVLTAGAVGFLPKPFHLAELSQLVATAITGAPR